MNGQEKINASHLERMAFVYVRQSTLTQVRENTGSKERQYAQVALARELGWAESLIEVIDDDLAKSATTSERRGGFQYLVAQVAMARGGAIFGVEVSRLSRSNADWYRLLDLCAANDTLVIDDGRVHDPASYDDRLLLGLKGTMADSEIHMMLSRLQGGRYRKALQGDYWVHPPVGYVRSEEGPFRKDPDERVRHAVEEFFKRFAECGSASAVAMEFWQKGIKFPVRGWSLAQSGELEWVTLSRNRAIYILHNPTYAGAFSYGRERKKKPRWAGTGPWPILLKGCVEPYVSWEQFMQNEKRLRENRPTRLTPGPPRRGHALLQGIVFCGKCGRRMGIVYQGTRGHHVAYQCRVAYENTLRHVCLSLTAKSVDRAVSRRLIEVLTRENLENALAIAREVEKRHQEEEREWTLRIEAAEYDAQRRFRQYNAIEPENRLVARSLEGAWEEKLQELEQIKQEHLEWSTTHPSLATEAEQRKLLDLLKDFRQVWESPTTAQTDRKKLVRLLVKDVTVSRGEGTEIIVGITWRSGMSEKLRIHNDNAPNAAMLPEVMDRIRALSVDHLDAEIAKVLNDEGYRSARNRQFTQGIVLHLRTRSALKKGHRGEPGYYSPPQLAALLGLSATTVVEWCRQGKLEATRQGRNATYWIRTSPDEIAKIRADRAVRRR